MIKPKLYKTLLFTTAVVSFSTVALSVSCSSNPPARKYVKPQIDINKIIEEAGGDEVEGKWTISEANFNSFFSVYANVFNDIEQMKQKQWLVGTNIDKIKLISSNKQNDKQWFFTFKIDSEEDYYFSNDEKEFESKIDLDEYFL